MRISDWSSDVCSSDLLLFVDRKVSWIHHAHTGPPRRRFFVPIALSVRRPAIVRDSEWTIPFVPASDPGRLVVDQYGSKAPRAVDPVKLDALAKLGQHAPVVRTWNGLQPAEPGRFPQFLIGAGRKIHAMQPGTLCIPRKIRMATDGHRATPIPCHPHILQRSK